MLVKNPSNKYFKLLAIEHLNILINVYKSIINNGNYIKLHGYLDNMTNSLITKDEDIIEKLMTAVVRKKYSIIKIIIKFTEFIELFGPIIVIFEQEAVEHYRLIFNMIVQTLGEMGERLWLCKRIEELDENIYKIEKYISCF